MFNKILYIRNQWLMFMRKLIRTKNILISKKGRKFIFYNTQINEKLRRQEYATNILNSIFV